MRRVTWMRLLQAWMFMLAALALPGAQAEQPFRIGLTPAFLHDQHDFLAEWEAYLATRLKRPVSFVLRDKYSDTMDLIRQGQLEASWLCDYPYVLMKSRVRLLATPVFRQRPYYRSYLIVPAGDEKTRSIVDLKAKVFAYADPFSYTGYLAPRYEIRRLGAHPDSFFRLTFFTWSHRKAIEAVASGLAQGAAVDSYVWESLARVAPDLTRKTRVVSRSPEFGFPPFVARNDLPEADFMALQKAFLEMNHDREGRRLLDKMFLDALILPDAALYKDVEDMVHSLTEGRSAHP